MVNLVGSSIEKKHTEEGLIVGRTDIFQKFQDFPTYFIANRILFEGKTQNAEVT